MLDHQWVVTKAGDDWTIGRSAAHVVLSGDHPVEALDEQLAEWGMRRSQLTTFEPEDRRAEFEELFGPVGESAEAAPKTS
jgi:hypothetical protein